MHKARRALALSLPFLLAAPALFAEGAAAEWPQYRGPSRDGTSPETGILASWPDDGPAVIWKRSIGTGFSGLSVADGRIYTMMAEGGKEHACAFDAATGDEIALDFDATALPADGGVLGRLRASPELADIPVLLVGSNAAVAAELPPKVDRIAKPVQPEELLKVLWRNLFKS